MIEMKEEEVDDLFTRQKAFGYTYEDVQKYLLACYNRRKRSTWVNGE